MAVNAPNVDRAIERLLARRSVSPRRLVAPGPSDAQFEQALQVALRAPDHGSLMPWRAIEIHANARDALARLFVDEKRRRDPLASDDDLARAADHALQAPALLAFVVRLRAGTTVPAHEQWLAAGAALGNLLNALDALGFGTIALSGERCADLSLAEALGVAACEQLVAFVSAGTVVKPPPEAGRKPLAAVWSRWTGPAPVTMPSHEPLAPLEVDMPARRGGVA